MTDEVDADGRDDHAGNNLHGTDGIFHGYGFQSLDERPVSRKLEVGRMKNTKRSQFGGTATADPSLRVNRSCAQDDN